MLASAKIVAIAASLVACYATITSAAPLDTRFQAKLKPRQQFDASKYPAPFAIADPAKLPKDWSDALNAAVAAGKVPNLPASIVANGAQNYPNGAQNDPNLCSWTVNKCNGPNDVSQGPDGVWTVAFDDGPTPASPDLYGFLQQQNQTGTHFMIGSNIWSYQDIFKQAMATGQEAAVHTWSHNLMTTLTNEQILGELGWTMQLIYDLSGRIPTLWRAPQGDVDARVRAIAENVFGLRLVVWNAECNDWCLTAQGGTACPGRNPGNDYQSVVNAVNAALAKPKSPGVMLLEHELTSYSVGIFKNYYPGLRGQGWTPKGVSDQLGKAWYTNAQNNGDTPKGGVTGVLVSENGGGGVNGSSPTSTTTSSSSSSSSSSAPTSVTTTTSTAPSSSNTTTTTSPNIVSTTASPSPRPGSFRTNGAVGNVLESLKSTLLLATTASATLFFAFF